MEFHNIVQKTARNLHDNDPYKTLPFYGTQSFYVKQGTQYFLSVVRITPSAFTRSDYKRKRKSFCCKRGGKWRSIKFSSCRFRENFFSKFIVRDLK